MEWLTLPNVYLTLFFAGLGITGILLVLGLAHDVFGGLVGGHEGGGGDVGGHDTGDASDTGDGGHHGAGYHGHGGFLHWLSALASPAMLSVFLTVFGGVGYLCSQTPALSLPLVNIPLSLGAGAFAVFGFLLPLRRWLFRLEGTSHPTTRDLVGLIGESLSPIPPNGIGSIAYVYNEIRHTAPARNRSEKEIPRGAPVRIVGVAGNLLLVENAEETLKVWEQL